MQRRRWERMNVNKMRNGTGVKPSRAVLDAFLNEVLPTALKPNPSIRDIHRHRDRAQAFIDPANDRR